MISRRGFIGGVSVRRSLAPAKPLNVLLIVADDLNCALGAYGFRQVRTPNIDSLARRGVVFENAHCQHPLCAPSRASFLSGTRPESNGVLSLTTPLRTRLRDRMMLPELFRRMGWHTAEIGKVFHTGAEHEDPRSWDERLPEWGKVPAKEEILSGREAPGPRNHTMAWYALRTRDEETPDGIVARRAVQVLEECARREQPFFVGAGFRRPHAPFAAPKRYFDLYPPDRIELSGPGENPALPAAAWYERRDQPRLSLREQKEYLAAYLACVSFIDAQTGVLLSALDRLSLWDTTVVVFLSDNGYHTGEHGMWHKMTLFEQSTRVPLIVAAAGRQKAGSRVRGLAELLDLYSTLPALCGLPPTEEAEGTDLTPWLLDPGRPGKRAAYTVVGRSENPDLHHLRPDYFGRSVRTSRWRYTVWDGGRKGRELYDHAADPLETRNVVDDRRLRAVVEQHERLLEQVPLRV